GEDTQITPAETGQTPEVTAENSNQNVVPIPYAPQRISHSAVRFWYDRFFLADSLQVNYKSSGSYLHVLRWPDIFEKIPEVRWFMHATYCRFELEIAIRPWNQDVVDYEMVYWPPGSLLPTDTVTWVSTADRRMRQSGPQPRWTWNTGTTPCFTARIPFTAPSSVLTQTYTGWSNTSHAEGTFGNTPGLNVLGALTLTQGSKNGSGTVITYISYRLVDIQMWCPRPGLYVAPPIQQ
nr:VP1 [hunnivirus A1]